ncbi:unnamed protein product [Enterobius vermicularis]|uniref:Caveolin n=1 Tax=Enterobius vermicularis TaxID=51028 RepID=A0A0N4UYM8_ENTVE|nr:unnamed protein product [Enterobius vermicularis]
MTIGLLNIENSNCSWFDDLKDGVSNIYDRAKQSLVQGWETNKGDVKVVLDQSKAVFGDLIAKVQDNSQKFKLQFLHTAESTLKGAGDEVESFFSEVPKTVDSGLRGLATKAEEGLTWIFRNIICPIIFILVLGGLIYLAVVSGCCSCCLSQCFTSLNMHFSRQAAKPVVTQESRPQIIVLSNLDLNEARQHLL